MEHLKILFYLLRTSIVTLFIFSSQYDFSICHKTVLSFSFSSTSIFSEEEARAHQAVFCLMERVRCHTIYDRYVIPGIGEFKEMGREKCKA